MSERLRHGLQLRNKREKGDRPRKGKGPSREGRTPAYLQPQGGSQQAYRQPQDGKRIVRQRSKPHPKEKAPSPKNNPLAGGRVEQVDQEADRRPGEHNGENQEPPKTLSHSEDHSGRGRQLSHRPRYKTPAGRKESRVTKTTPDPQQGSWRQH